MLLGLFTNLKESPNFLMKISREFLVLISMAPSIWLKSFSRLLIKRPEAQILNVSSMGGYVPVPGQTVYGASKAAIKLFTEGLRSELKGTKVGVALLFPGAVNTNISINSGALTAD
jgi:short-subunit dehydrogenase